jgi:hypothetical protein
MQAAFEAFERGEEFHPSPEMVERMHAEMERWISEHPEMAEYARAEFGHFEQFGPEMGERYGSGTDFERWAAEGGHSPEEMERMYEMYREFGHEEGLEFYHEFETLERNYDTVLENSPTATVQSGETLVRTEIHVFDHDGNGFTENHPHEIYQHSDGKCHDHGAPGGGAEVGC